MKRLIIILFVIIGGCHNKIATGSKLQKKHPEQIIKQYRQVIYRARNQGITTNQWLIDHPGFTLPDIIVDKPN